MIDPLSGTSKPLPPPEILESRIRRPLQFAATLLPADQLAKPTQRRHREIERVPGVPLDGHHDAPGSVSEAKDEIARLLADVKRLNIGVSNGDGDAPRLTRPVPFRSSAVGSSEWIESRIEALIFDADTTSTAASTLDLSGLAMPSVTEKIAELQDMTRLAQRPRPRQQHGYGDPRAALGAGRVPGQGRQFKRYSSAPLTTGTIAAPRPPTAVPTPRAVSGPTQPPRPAARTRSSLHRELSAASSASSAGRDGWSRVPSSSAGSALGEGESFASTCTAVSDLSTGTLVEVDEGEASGNVIDKGKGVDRGLTSRRLGDPASAVSHFRKMHQIQPATASARTFAKSASAMTPFSPTGASPALEMGRRREGMHQKTVSFAAPGAAPPAATLKTRTASAAWSRSPSGTWNPAARDSWKGDSRGDVQLILSNNALTW